jgi:hypothetical protein
MRYGRGINPLNAELNPICHFLALLGGATIVVVSRLRVNGHEYRKEIKVCFNLRKNFCASETVVDNLSSISWVLIKKVTTSRMIRYMHLEPW